MDASGVNCHFRLSRNADAGILPDTFTCVERELQGTLTKTTLEDVSIMLYIALMIASV